MKLGQKRHSEQIKESYRYYFSVVAYTEKKN